MPRFRLLGINKQQQSAEKNLAAVAAACLHAAVGAAAVSSTRFSQVWFRFGYAHENKRLRRIKNGRTDACAAPVLVIVPTCVRSCDPGHGSLGSFRQRLVAWWMTLSREARQQRVQFEQQDLQLATTERTQQLSGTLFLPLFPRATCFVKTKS